MDPINRSIIDINRRTRRNTGKHKHTTELLQAFVDGCDTELSHSECIHNACDKKWGTEAKFTRLSDYLSTIQEFYNKWLLFLDNHCNTFLNIHVHVHVSSIVGRPCSY